jgi:hypothetical protein
MLVVAMLRPLSNELKLEAIALNEDAQVAQALSQMSAPAKQIKELVR